MQTAGQGCIGIAVNPASGKDVRRLVARASVFDNQEKRAIVRRAIVGALGAGANTFAYVPDSHGITESALAEFGAEISRRAVDSPQTASALDTIRGARELLAIGCAVVLTLGGDGTNRAFALGWRDAPLLPISTGTNNVFPRFVEATIAGAAAGLIASGAVALAHVASRVKAIRVEIDGERDDLALIDAVLTDDRFIGARALLDADSLRLALLTRADPAAVGMTALGGLLAPLAESEDRALLLTLGRGPGGVRAPIAPGLYATVRVADTRHVAFGEVVSVTGPGVLAFDGERERVLQPNQRARLTVGRDGPWVVDVAKALAHAAARGTFRVHIGEVDGD
ncbi:MAG TPA: NAD(+)/NADH kinase [Pseudomonadales bacterium]